MNWIPLQDTLFVDDAEGDNGDNLVAIAQDEEKSVYKCYNISVSRVDIAPKNLLISKTQVKRTVSDTYKELSSDRCFGSSIMEDLGITILDWMQYLNAKDFERSLLLNMAKAVSIANVEEYSEGARNRKLLKVVNSTKGFLEHAVIARNLVSGVIMGLHDGAVELARSQIGMKAPSSLSLAPREKFDTHLEIELGERLQNQTWRMIAYIIGDTRESGTMVHDIEPWDTQSITVTFSHLISSNMSLAIELSAKDGDCYTRIACGVAKLPIKETAIEMVTPYGNAWGDLVERLMDGEVEDSCSLISNVSVKPTSCSYETVIPSLVRDGFNTYNALYIDIGDFHAHSHENASYYIKFRVEDSVVVDQEVSSFLLSGTSSHQRFIFYRFKYGEPIKAELWRDHTLISLAKVNYKRDKFAITFQSLVTFQSIGLTKTLAVLQCKATYMGVVHNSEPAEMVKNFHRYTDSEIISAMRNLDINQDTFSQFQQLGSSLLCLMEYHLDNELVHEAAFTTLLELLELGDRYPYIIKTLFESMDPPLPRSNVLAIVLRQITLLMQSEVAVNRVLKVSLPLRDLLVQLAPSKAEVPDQTEKLFDISTMAAQRVSTNMSTSQQSSNISVRSSSLRSMKYLRGSIKALALSRIPIPLPSETCTGFSSSPSTWRGYALVDMVRHLVTAMQTAYSNGSTQIKKLFLANIESIFVAFKALLGEHAVQLLFSFLSAIPWCNNDPDLNTEKLFLITRVPVNWSLDGNSTIIYSSLCINAVAPVWVGKRDARRWIDVRATASILNCLIEKCDISSLSSVFSEFLPLTIDVCSDLAAMDKWQFNMNGVDCLFPTEICKDSFESIAVEMMLVIYQLLRCESKMLTSSLNLLGQSHLSLVAFKTMSVCEFWLDCCVFKPEWISLKFLQYRTIHEALLYLSRILQTYFIPSPDANIFFDADIWYRYFALLCKFQLLDALEVPSDVFEAECHEKILSDTRIQSVELLKRSWDSLTWSNPTANPENVSYGYQVNLFCCPNNVTLHFIELCFTGEMIKVVGPFLQQIISTEYSLNESMHDLLVEFMVALDDLFIKRQKEGKCLPSLPECQDFCNLLRFDEGKHINFAIVIESFIQLLSDNYRHDSLLTVYRILGFLKKQRVTSLFHRYIVYILKTEKNYRVLAHISTTSLDI